jgi:Zn-dependent protease
VVGPVTSLLLAGLFWLIDVVGRGVLSTPVAGMFGYLGWVNLLLAAFNLVPRFPLDGGLLRSPIWKATGNFGQATRIASLAGQGVGWLLVAAGVAFLLGGNLAGGLVRVHRLVPGPGRPVLLRGHPAAGSAPRRRGRGRDGP